jgi:cytochrome c
MNGKFMYSKIFPALFILAFFFLSSCSDEIVSDCDTGDNTLEPTFANVQTEVFDKHCISCHGDNGPQGGLILSPGVAYDNIININSKKNSNFKLISPGSSHESYIYKALVSDGAPQMPTTGALPEHKIELVKQWIDSGAETINYFDKPNTINGVLK